MTLKAVFADLDSDGFQKWLNRVYIWFVLYSQNVSESADANPHFINCSKWTDERTDKKDRQGKLKKKLKFSLGR